MGGRRRDGEGEVLLEEEGGGGHGGDIISRGSLQNESKNTDIYRIYHRL